MSDEIAKMLVGALASISLMSIAGVIWALKRFYWDSRRLQTSNGRQGKSSASTERDVGRFAPLDREVLGRIDTNQQVHMAQATLWTTSLRDAVERQTTAIAVMSQAVASSLAAHTSALQTFTQNMVQLNNSLARMFEEDKHG